MTTISGGKYASEVLKGRVFIGSTVAAGVALPIGTAAGTAATFGIWNTDPTKYAVLHYVRGGYTSGTIALGTLGLANYNCGYATATGAPLTAFTDATSATLKNALVGSGNTSSMRFTPSSATLTAGGTQLTWFGHSIESATAGTGIQTFKEEFDGGIIVMPGQFVYVCSSVAQTALFSLSMCWSEVPICS